MSADTQLYMRPMLIAGSAMYRVRRQSYSYSLVSDHHGTVGPRGMSQTFVTIRSVKRVDWLGTQGRSWHGGTYPLLTWTLLGARNGPKLTGCTKSLCTWPLDRFIKTYFWNFQKCQAFLYYILINKQMLEKVYCSNITPSLSSGNHLFYKAEYMGQSCPNQVWAITFDWSALAT